MQPSSYVCICLSFNVFPICFSFFSQDLIWLMICLDYNNAHMTVLEFKTKIMLWQS